MGLKVYKEKNRLQQSLIVCGILLVLLIAVIVVFRTYALFEMRETYDVIQGEVPSYIDNFDVKVALTIDGVVSTTIPDKGSGKAVDSIECDKGAIGAWDYTNWNLIVKSLSSTRTKCQINFKTKYTESILNGTDPVLADGLIPIVINSDGMVKKASEGSEWYNYSNKIWANAVILEDENIVYNNGETIPESNIESYFVWIPRYRYKIFNTGNYTSLTAVENKVQTIEIEFENKSTATSNGSIVGSWLTHPAFVSFDVNGMWVGKFETGYKGATSTIAAKQNISDSSKVEIKPNVYSWRGIQVSNAFYTSYNYKREMDSHMMKNTEWGAVAYLSHSAYGSRSSVRINNNSAYITGYSAVSEPTCGLTGTNESCNRYESTTLGVDGVYTLNYFNPASVVSSTTGNYSGVYDMSGGTYESVMGVMLDQSGNPMSGRNSLYNSGFNGTLGCPTCDIASGNNSSITSLTTGVNFPESKYYDTYGYEENTQTYNRRILGDATGEIGPFVNNGTQNRQISSWYADEAFFVNSVVSWFRRGSDFPAGSGAGVFTFNSTNGESIIDYSFRVVLSI